MSADLFAKLATRLGPKGHATDAATLASYLTEWRDKYQGHTPFLALPASTEEVADIVRLCAEARHADHARKAATPVSSAARSPPAKCCSSA